jgi:hypothetical protein
VPKKKSKEWILILILNFLKNLLKKYLIVLKFYVKDMVIQIKINQQLNILKFRKNRIKFKEKKIH